MTTEKVIQKFYTSFQNKDYKTMQQCYAGSAIFNDPVFRNLNATQVKAMWEMFCVKSKDLKIEFGNITANETNGSAEWTATYIFSPTGKKVVNKITANFIFENQKIVKHTDTFNFYKWAKQALGLSGVLLGWTPLAKNKVQKAGMKTLNDYIIGK
ncbi:MAG: nuclear transport factor 2 family protein [Parafilimonas sp.]